MRETVCDSGKKYAHVSILALPMLCHLPAVLWGNRGVETKDEKKKNIISFGLAGKARPCARRNITSQATEREKNQRQT